MTTTTEIMTKEAVQIPVPQDEQQLTGSEFTPYTCEPIHGDPTNKNLLSALQLNVDDIYDYLDEAARMKEIVDDPSRRGSRLLPFTVLKAVMRQPSTRTGGSMTTAMNKLGGVGELISGMHSSSEAKGETLEDSWVAFATQADILGIRTKENGGPAFAAYAIAKATEYGKLTRKVPVINLGDGHNEHITQGIGDMFTMRLRKGDLDGKIVAYVGDHERYRANHSGMILAAEMGATVLAVESVAAPVPDTLAQLLGSRLQRTESLDEAMRAADILNIGRNPDEYDGGDEFEQWRSELLAQAYAGWRIDYDRLQIMRPDAIVMHPRPRRNELHHSVDRDPRMADVEQMDNMIPARMAIIARHLGVSARNAHAA